MEVTTLYWAGLGWVVSGRVELGWAGVWVGVGKGMV